VPSKNIKTRTEVLQKFNLTQADIVRIFNDDECALDGLADNNETFRLFVIKKNGTEILLGDMPPDAVFSIRFRSIKFEPEAEDYSQIDITERYPNIKGRGGIRVSGIANNLMIRNNRFIGGAVLGGQSIVNFKQRQIYNQFFNGGVVIGGTIDVEYKESQKYFEISSGGSRVAGTASNEIGHSFSEIGNGGAIAGGTAETPMILVFDTSKTGVLQAVICPKGTVNVWVDWGDGTSNKYSNAGAKSHVYTNSGIYTVKISGTMTSYGYVFNPFININ
jgi:hypothetical protein